MRRADATRLYYVIQILSRVPTWVVMAVFLVSELDLSPLQLILMGTAMEAAVFLFEVPTGVVADTYSRRLSLIVGYLGMGLAWMLVGVVSAAVADHRALGVLGLLVHVHERRRAGLDHRRGGSRESPVASSCKGSRIAYVGSVLGLIVQVAIGLVSLRAGVIAGGAATALCGVLCIVAACPRPASSASRGTSADRR